MEAGLMGHPLRETISVEGRGGQAGRAEEKEQDEDRQEVASIQSGQGIGQEV